MEIKIQQDALVVLVGAMATGKSTFADKHFASHHIVETDFIRSQLTGDFDNQDYSSTAFEILFATVEARAKAGILTVIDSTGNQSVLDRTREIAKIHDRPLVALVFPALPEEQITEERFKHRWKKKGIYNRQVNRISKQTIHNDYDHYYLADLNHNSVVDDVTIEYESYSDEHKLDPKYSYVVIPDLHGEYRVLEQYIEKYKDDDNVKFISLGDIVDRGESSYKTFNLLFDLIADGKLDNVVSNHCNKLYRYFRKWLMDDNNNKYHTLDGYDKYGMSIAHGLSNTLEEFYDLSAMLMDDYVDRFINYYETSHPYLFVEKGENTHYFAHAGISSGVAIGQQMTKRDLAAVMYETIEDPEVLTDIFKHVQTNVHVHVGHDHNSDDITFHPNKDGTRWFIRHDTGLGKRPIDYDKEGYPEFMVIRA